MKQRNQLKVGKNLDDVKSLQNWLNALACLDSFSPQALQSVVDLGQQQPFSMRDSLWLVSIRIIFKSPSTSSLHLLPGL
jgi:hypothetical protein